jgi:hypothetical protein
MRFHLPNIVIGNGTPRLQTLVLLCHSEQLRARYTLAGVIRAAMAALQLRRAPIVTVLDLYTDANLQDTIDQMDEQPLSDKRTRPICH